MRMEHLEHLYLVDARQLLLLLALSGAEPPLVFGLPDPGAIEPGVWSETAVELLKNGWLQYGARSLCPVPDLADLLAVMRAAPRVLAVWCKRGAGTVKLLYPGPRTVVLERYGAAGYRLYRQAEEGAAPWAESLGLPEPAPPPPSAPVWDAGQTPPDVPWASPAPLWGRLPGVQTVAALYTADGTERTRWIWQQCQGSMLLLEQTAEALAAEWDSPRRREQLYADWSVREELP